MGPDANVNSGTSTKPSQYMKGRGATARTLEQIHKRLLHLSNYSRLRETNTNTRVTTREGCIRHRYERERKWYKQKKHSKTDTLRGTPEATLPHRLRGLSGTGPKDTNPEPGTNFLRYDRGSRMSSGTFAKTDGQTRIGPRDAFIRKPMQRSQRARRFFRNAHFLLVIAESESTAGRRDTGAKPRVVTLPRSCGWLPPRAAGAAREHAGFCGDLIVGCRGRARPKL